MRKIKTKTIEAKDQNAKIEKSQKNHDPKKSPNALLAHPREPRTLFLPTYSSSLSQKYFARKKKKQILVGIAGFF